MCKLPHQNHRGQCVHHWRVSSSSRPTPLCTDFPCTECAGFFQERATSEILQERNLHDVECADLQRQARAAHKQSRRIAGLPNRAYFDTQTFTYCTKNLTTQLNRRLQT